ncbi:MAG TPA: glycosyltransferase family 87 protein [Anaerolineaceae bacterium]|nr:glycosyltransferase family 87 protein [Anaerolineaceae bacterium]
MYRRHRVIKEIILILLIVLVIGLFFYANYQYTRINPGGNDFLVHWVGTKAFVNEGISPYSDEVASRIQNLVYGRPALSGEHELRVAYPFYSILLFLPFSLIGDYMIARAVWMTVLEIAIITSIMIALRTINWKPKILTTLLLIVFGLFWYHGLRSIINGNAVVLILFAVTLILYGIKFRQDELVGFCLALITIKPQVVIVFTLFIVFWAIINRRFKIIFWFIGTTVVLILLGLFLLPSWPMEFLREVMRYPEYNPPGTPATALFALAPGIGKQLGLLISIICAIILLAEWFLGRTSSNLRFFWIACLTLILGQWVNIQTDPGNFIIMFPAILISFKVIENRWKNIGQWINLFLLSILFFVPWLIFINTINFEYQPIQNPIMFFPIPLLLLTILYWVRWWVKNPVTDLLDS